MMDGAAAVIAILLFIGLSVIALCVLDTTSARSEASFFEELWRLSGLKREGDE